MPNKTIYVTDDDIEIFERAQKLAGSNLSATIAAALKRFVEIEEKKNEGFEEIPVRIGENGLYNQKRFIGKELGRTQFLNEDGNKATVIIVYETAKQQYAVYTQEVHRAKDDLMKLATEQKLASKLGVQVDITIDSSVWAKGNTYRLDVYKTSEELKVAIPTELYNAIFENGSSDFLDI
jgi:EXLDI family protein